MCFLLLTTNVIIFRHVKRSYWLHCTKYFSRNGMYEKLNKIVQGAPCGSFFKACVGSCVGVGESLSWTWNWSLTKFDVALYFCYNTNKSGLLFEERRTGIVHSVYTHCVGPATQFNYAKNLLNCVKETADKALSCNWGVNV